MIRKKIIFIISRYEINGVCAVAKNLMDNLDRNKFEIILFIEKIAERHFPIHGNIKTINLNLKPQRGFIKKIMNVFGILQAIAKADKKEKPDVVLSFGSLPNCYTLLALKLFSRTKAAIIITEHSEGFYVRYKRPNIKEKTLVMLYKFMIYSLYGLADYIIAVSENIAQLIKSAFLIKKEKIKVIYNPVDIANIKDLSEEKVDDLVFQKDVSYLAVVSRLSREKGIDYLIKAIANFADTINLELLIIGEGEHEEMLRDLSMKYKINDRVRFLGWKDNPFKYLRKCNIFVLPSIYEGFPNVILEAMACNVPVIASRCTVGIEEIIDNYINGILVPIRNTEALSKGIYNLLADEELRQKLKYNAFEKVKRFDISRVIKQYEEVLTN